MIYLDGVVTRMNFFEKIKNHFQVRYEFFTEKYKSYDLDYSTYMGLFYVQGENEVEDYIFKSAHHEVWVTEGDVWFSLCYAAGPEAITPTQANYWLNYYENKGMIVREEGKFKYPSFEYAQRLLKEKTVGNSPN